MAHARLHGVAAILHEMQPMPIRTVQIILFAMAGGLVLFSGVVVMLRLTPGALGEPVAPDFMALAVPIVFAVNAVVCLILQNKARQSLMADRTGARTLVKSGAMPGELSRAAISGAALAEGGGLLGVVVTLLGGSWFLLAAPAVSVIWILLLIPTGGRLEDRLKDLA